MPTKKNPLENARKRVKEKLSSIEEQSEFICQFIDDLTKKAKGPATELLQESERTKFFSKYSSVSQELEKCLDILLLISDSITTLADGDLDESGLSDDEAVTGCSTADDPISGQSKAQNEDQQTKSTNDEENQQSEGKEGSRENQEEITASKTSKDEWGNVEEQKEPSNVLQEQKAEPLERIKVEEVSESPRASQGQNNEPEGSKVIKKVSESSRASQGQDHEPEGIKVKDVSGSLSASQRPGQKHEPEGIKVKDVVGSLSASQGQNHEPEGIKVEEVSGASSASQGHKHDPEERKVEEFRVSPTSSLEQTEEAKRTKDSASVSCQASGPTACTPEKTQTVNEITPTPESTQTDMVTPVESKQMKGVIVVDNKASSRNVGRKGTKRNKSPPQKTRKVVTVSRRSSSSSSIQDVVREIKTIQAATSILDLCQIPTNKAVYLKPYPFENGCCLEVIVTEVLSPWEFWVQPALEDFNDVMEEMCFYYAKAAAAGYTGGLTEPPNVGSFCCARFTADDTWYRVVVTAAHDQETSPRFEVLCVDDGHRDVLSMSALRPLEEKFTTLPCQAICCALSGVQPLPLGPSKMRQVSSVWSQESTGWLKSKVRAVKLLAYPTRTEDGHLVTVDLYRSPGKKTPRGQVPAAKYSIAHAMVEEGKCSRIGLPVSAETQSTCSLSPRSFRSEESLSRTSSLTSVSSGAQDGAMPAFPSETALLGLMPSIGGRDGPTDRSVSPLDVTGDGNVQNAIVQNVIEQNVTVQNVIEQNVTVQHVIEQNVIEQFEQGTPAIPLEDISISCDAPQERAFAGGLPVDVPQESAFAPQECVFAPQECAFAPQECVFAPQECAFAPQECAFAGGLPVDAPQESAFVEAPPVDVQSKFIQVMMSHMVSPSEFYVHLATPEAGMLDIMMDEINKHYNENESSYENSPQMGGYYCARFSEDQRWYRVQVRTVRHDEQNGEDEVFTSAQAEVFYVDFGNTDWVTVSEIRPLVTTFMQLPGQVIRCSLANVQPLLEPDSTPSLQDCPTPMPEADSGYVKNDVKEEKAGAAKSPVKERRLRKKKIHKDENVVVRAAGDESCDSSETSDLGLLGGINEDATSQPADKVGLPEKYLLPTSTGDVQTPAIFSAAEAKPVPKWTSEAIELFKGLCEDEKQLMAHIVPWNEQLYDRLFDPMADGKQVDVFYQKPELCLYLYDTTGDEDIFVNQVLTETGLAVFVQTDVGRGETNSCHPEGINVINLTEEALQEAAATLELNDSADPVQSPTSQEMKKWDPMASDFLSVKNTYAIDTDDLDIAFQGYKNPSRTICHFFQTKAGCWRGGSCPNAHPKYDEEVTNTVEAFCGGVDCVVSLPDPGTWVAVCITAIFNPGHFWVQLPYGSEPLEKQIIEARSGKYRDEEDDLEALMDKMWSFYSTNVCQDPSRILNAIGEIVVARYSKDGKWYRSRVVDVRDEELQVFFVDYGNSEWTAESNIKRMIPHFLHLPFQAVECILANVEPANEGECGWSDGAKEAFKSFAADKVMIAHVLSKAWNKTLCLDLYDTDGPDDVHINKALIEKRFAQESKHLVMIPCGDMKSNPHQLAGLPG